MIKINMQWLIIIVLLFLSSDIQSEEASPPPTIEESQKKSITYSQQLASYYDKEKVIWVNPNKKQVFMVRSDNLHNITYGNILLISENEQRPLAMGVNDVLNQKLTQLGWNLFHLYLPNANLNKPKAIVNVDKSNVINEDTGDVSQNSTPDPQEITVDDYRQQIADSIKLIQNSNNDEVFILVHGLSSDVILKILAGQLAQIDGVVFLLPKIVTFNPDLRQKLTSVTTPQYIFYSKSKKSASQSESWIAFLHRSQRPSITIDKNLPPRSSLADGSFYAFRIHRWLKKLTFKIPN